MGVNPNAPVIIKRKKKIIAGGHHGGAWKVAYADFVTAMMAFFMLMWLLNATTEKQRKGIADYFSPTIPIVRISGGGEGSFAGDSIFSQETLTQNGTGATSKESASDNGQDQASFAEVEDALSGMAGESMVADDMLRHIVTRVTDEGLIIELFDIPGESLFKEQTNTPEPIMIELAEMISQIIVLVNNGVAVNGFTRSYPVILTENPVWNLSSSRAHVVRQLLENSNLSSKRMERVSGYADRKPAARNPMAERNNRIELILLRQNK